MYATEIQNRKKIFRVSAEFLSSFCWVAIDNTGAIYGAEQQETVHYGSLETYRNESIPEYIAFPGENNSHNRPSEQSSLQKFLRLPHKVELD